jgi:hypothetical protein
MYHTSRFYVVDDIFHRLFEVASLLSLASAVLHIRTVPIMSDPAHNVDMFAFSLSVAIAHALAFVRAAEIMICQWWFKTKGLYPESFYNSQRDCVWVGIPTLFFLAASIYSGIEYYGSDEKTKKESDAEDGYHRSLAGEEDKYASATEDDVAIILCLAGVLSGMAVLAIIMFIVLGSWRTIDHKKYALSIMMERNHSLFLRVISQNSLLLLHRYLVPMNIDYAIHRYGEWTMLLLGER